MRSQTYIQILHIIGNAGATYRSQRKTYNKTCETSKDSDQHLHPPSTSRVLVYSSLNNLEAVEGTCDQRRL